MLKIVIGAQDRAWILMVLPGVESKRLYMVSNPCASDTAYKSPIRQATKDQPASQLRNAFIHRW